MADWDVETSQDWLDTATDLPVRFAQVREDPLLDIETVRRSKSGCNALIIASGGCTVCALNTLGHIDEMVVVDPNPAQIVLTRLKLLIQDSVPPSHRAGLLGHEPMAKEERGTQLAQLATEYKLDLQSLGPLAVLASRGLDFIGRYEIVFGAVSRLLADDHEDISQLLMQNDFQQRISLLESMQGFLNRLESVLNRVMALPNLVHLFGEEATRNRLQDFSAHFFQRTQWAITQLPTESNHYLWQVLLNQSPPGHSVPWLSMKLPNRLPTKTFHQESIEEYLGKCERIFDYIHLSNVLDWLSDDQARSLLASTWDHLAPGGHTLIRQLNSNLDIPSMNDRFEWLDQDSHDLLLRDRSFFYRKIHLGRKP